MNISFMTVLKLLYFICSSLLVLAAGDDLGFCADAQCSMPVGMGHTLTSYNNIGFGILSFKQNQEVEIYVKEFGIKKELLGVKIDGKTGFVPKNLVREMRTMVKNLVPAAVKFAQAEINPFPSQVSSQMSDATILNAMPDTVFTEASIPGYHAGHGSTLESSIGSGPNEHSQAFEPDLATVFSSGGYVDPLFGSTTQQQAVPDPGHMLQVSNPHPNDIQQQFNGLKTVQFPQHPADSHSPPLNFGSSFVSNVPHPSVSEMNSFAQQAGESELPSQNPSISNTQTQQLYNTHAELNPQLHVLQQQFNVLQQQNSQFDLANPQKQQQFDSLQSSFTYQSEGNFPQNSFSSDVNSAGSEVLSSADGHTGSAYPDWVAENQGLPILPGQQPGINVNGQPNHPPSVSHEAPSENNLYQDTSHLMRKNGLDYDDYTRDLEDVEYGLPDNRGFLSDPYNQGYSQEIPSDPRFSQPSHYLFPKDQANLRINPILDNIPGTLQQKPSQTNVDALSSTSSLDPSFYRNPADRQVENPSSNAAIELTSSSTEQMLDISEKSGTIKKNEDSASVFEGVEVEVESVESDVEEIYVKNNVNYNTLDRDNEIKKDIISNQDKVHNFNPSSKSVDTVLPSETQISNSYESNSHTNTHEIRPQTNTHELNTPTNSYETNIQTANYELNTKTGNHETNIQTANYELNTKTGNHESNTQAANPESNTQTGIHESNTQTGIHESNTQTGIHESNTQTGIHESNTQTGIHESNTHTDIHESNAHTGIHESNTQTANHESNKQDILYPSNTTGNYVSDTIENGQKHEKDTSLDKDLVFTNDLNNQNINSVVPSETQSLNVQETDTQSATHLNNDNITASSYVAPSQVELHEASSKNTFDTKAGGSEEDIHVDKVEIENNNVVEVKSGIQKPDENEIDDSFEASMKIESTTMNRSQIEENSNEHQNDGLLPEEINIPPDTSEKSVYVLPFDVSTQGSVNETNSVLDNEQETLNKIVNVSEMSEADQVGYLNPYQIRNLKEDQKGSENVEMSDDSSENVTYPEDEYSTIENSLEAIRSFIEALLPWIPEPLYTVIMDLENKGISPRVPVFTALSALPCILLILAFVYIKEKSKENKLTVQLAMKEKVIFMISAEKVALEDKLEKTTEEFESSKSMLLEERETFDSMKLEVGNLKQEIEKSKYELENSADEINTLKEREKEYIELVKDHEKIHLDLMQEKSEIEKKVAEQEDYINRLTDQVEEKDDDLASLQAEVEKLKKSNADYEEKLAQLQTNCNQLLKEAEVWNMRVNELNSKLSTESSAKEELENSMELKESEIKSLTYLVQTFKSFEEADSGNEDEQKSNEEKLQYLMDSTKILIKLQQQEEENNIISTKLSGERNKILEMEVDLLESKSENDKLKLNYNQALQDKTEATTKLEVLTNYFKDKEILLQRQLGAQEAFREKREKDADSAERQIVLIEQENASYKYQVASMKQEMEETERNLKSQIATQEQKAHENWITARAAERKLEDMKQEVTQLRQRLTLLEREQENWVNNTRDDVIRPIPKRISGMNDDSSSVPDLNNSLDPRHMFPPPPPMLLPSDRPLPPLPPLPPFMPPMEPPFRPPQPPWHMESDFRMTPPDFMRRELTPPRVRNSAITDGDRGPLQSSPLDTRESRDSTPPNMLPDFHDIPPPPQRPYFPPPPHHPRFPMPPIFRREFPPHKRTDSQSDTSSTGRGTQPTPSSQEHWQHNSRV